jgi:hypothetical protein
MLDVMAQNVVADYKRHLRQCLFELVKPLFYLSFWRNDFDVTVEPNCSNVEDPRCLRIDLEVNREAPFQQWPSVLGP